MSWYYKKSKPIRTDEGIKATSQRGAFVENWWADRWIDTLERLMDAGRLRRGKRYARAGQVLSIEEVDGGVEAKVQGSRSTPYTVTIELDALRDEEWESVLDALADRASFTAHLLAGDMPADIEEAFEAADVSLFPDTRGDLRAECSCPDWAEVCKHIAATHYILGERFDQDPFLLFRLRGRTQEQIMQALRERRGADTDEDNFADAEASTTAPLPADFAGFWTGQDSLEHLSIDVSEPATPRSVLKRLGQPGFLREDLEEMLTPAYTRMTDAALSAAFGDTDESETDDAEEDDTGV